MIHHNFKKPEEYEQFANYLLNLGEIQEATECFLYAIRFSDDKKYYQNIFKVLSPDFENFVSSFMENWHPSEKGKIYNNLSIVFRERRITELAKKFLKLAIKAEPENYLPYKNLGYILSEENDLQESADNYRKAYLIKPDDINSNNLGRILQRQNKFEEADEFLLKAVLINPQKSDYIVNLGVNYFYLHKYNDAESCYRDAIRINHDSYHAHLNLGILLLLNGRYVEGFKEYEWRRKLEKYPFNKPYWDGNNNDEEIIFISHEQGLGDTIQILRYLDKLVSKAGKFIVKIPKDFEQFFSGKIFSNVEIIFDSPSPEKFDSFSYLMTLPLIFETTLETIPNNIPYIYADKNLSFEWKQVFSKISASDKLKIGIVWESGRINPTYHLRSCPLHFFYKLNEISDIEVFSIQKGGAEKQIKNIPENVKITDLSGKIKTFSDTAAIIENLDLVISVDTAVVHLAGAMGKPVWNLLNYLPDWRWGIEGNYSVWYPSMKIFRQKSFGNWESVFENVYHELLLLQHLGQNC